MAQERTPSRILPFIREAPKAELHLHLRGAMPGRYFIGLLRKYSAARALAAAPRQHLEWFRSAPNLAPFLADASLDGAQVLDDRAAGLFGYENFEQFLATYLFTSYFFRDISDFQGLIDEVRRELIAQNVVYAEVTVSVIEYLNQGLELTELIAAMEVAAQSPQLRIQWIVDLVRNFGPEITLDALRRILALRPDSVCGITLGGAEHEYPPEQFAEHYRLARDAGLRLTVHAGEAVGPESVWGAIRSLGVERIGHGVRAIEDPKLVEYLAEHQIPLEVCPTSNLRTGVYRSYDEHPVRRLYEAGVPISISTDDPTFFSTSLVKEFEYLSALGFSDGELLDLLKNGFRHAFLNQHEVAAYVARLEDPGSGE